MPLYEFVCDQCGTEFETLMGMSANEPGPECPECSSPEVAKKVSRFASSSGGGTRSAAPRSSCTPRRGFS